MPTWIVLLAALPATGLGVGACLALATAGAIAAVVVAGRLMRPAARERSAARAAGRRGPMSPLAAAALTLGAVAVLVYVVFVIANA